MTAPLKIKTLFDSITDEFKAMATKSGQPIFKTIINNYKPVRLEEMDFPALFIFNRGGKQTEGQYRGDDQLNLTLLWEFHIMLPNQTETAYFSLLKIAYAVAHKLQLNQFNQPIMPFKGIMVNTDNIDEYYGNLSRITDKEKFLVAAVFANTEVCFGESHSSQEPEYGELETINSIGGVV